MTSASPTPFHKDGAIDFDWVEGHLEYLRRHGADGTLIAGTTGEGPSLTGAEKRQLTDIVMAARSDLAVVVGCGAANLEDTVEMATYAHEKGADSVLILPPFFFKNVPAMGLIEYFGRLIDALPSDQKVCLYNIPQVSAVEISDDLLDGLLERRPGRVLGIKDSSGRLERTASYIEKYPMLRIWSGGDQLMSATFGRGVHGVMSGTSCFVPDLAQAIRRAVSEELAVAEAQAALDTASKLALQLDVRAAFKYLIHLRSGLPEVFVRPPLVDPTPEQKATLQAGFERLRLPISVPSP